MQRLAVLLLVLLPALVLPHASYAYTWSGTVQVSEQLREAGFIYANEERPQPEDSISGSFSVGVAGQPGVPLPWGAEQLQAASFNGQIGLTPVAYPMYFEWDPDCTWSRSWDGVAFNGAPGTLEVTTFTEDFETGARDDTRGSILLFRADDQVDDRGRPFGYDHTETAGRDATCDDPGKSSESRFYDVLKTREYGLRLEGLPIVRDSEGRLFIQATIEQAVSAEGTQPVFPHMAQGHGKRTVTIDLTGLPAGVPPPEEPEPPTKRCENFAGGFTTREYSASAYPNLELFRFSPSVSYRFTASCVQITKAHGSGFVDWGLDTYALALLGFEVRYDESNVRFGVPSDKVSLTSAGGSVSARIMGDFDVKFDWTALLVRVRLTKVLDKLEDRLAKKIEAYVRRRYPQPDLLSREQRIELRRKWIPEVQRKVIVAFDEVLEKVPGPEFLRKAIAQHVMDVVQGKLELLEKPTDFTSGHHRVKQVSRILAGDIVGGARELLTSALPNDFSLWSPDITVTVAPGGHVSYAVEGFLNPFMSFDLVPGSERDVHGEPPVQSGPRVARTPESVARTAAQAAAQTLSAMGLRSGSNRVRVPAEAGRLSVTVTAGGGSASASAARTRVLARGVSSSSTAGWRTVKLVVRRGVKLPRRPVRATIAVTFKSAAGTQSTQRVSAKVGRARR